MERPSGAYEFKALARKQKALYLLDLLCPLFFPEDAGIMFLRNVGELPYCTVLHPGR
jgi:hypothetical protein